MNFNSMKIPIKKIKALRLILAPRLGNDKIKLFHFSRSTSLIIFVFFIFMIVFGIANSAVGQTYELLEGLPGIQEVNVGPGGFGSYIQKIFVFIIGFAGVLAVLMIVLGGIQYMTSEAFTSKQAAKERITAAILGLLLAIASVLILETINPNLLNLNLNLSSGTSSSSQTFCFESSDNTDPNNPSFSLACFNSINECGQARLAARQAPNIGTGPCF